MGSHMGNEGREQAEAVQRMQDFIEEHLDQSVTLDQLAEAAGYSPWHALRLFTRWVGMKPTEYVRARRMTVAAKRLRDTQDPVGEVAINCAFQTHEGFTRAFSGFFGTTPSTYRRATPPIPLFMPRSALLLFDHQHPGDLETMETTPNPAIFVHPVRRPARKLILQRATQATDYFAYCEELGCDVWGVLDSLKGALYEAMGMWLPENLRRPGTATYAMGVEVPCDYNGPIPEGMEIIDLPPCDYLVFHGQPYPEEKMAEAIRSVWEAMAAYDPTPTGWVWADQDGPRFQLAPMGHRGYIEGRPARPTATSPSA